LVVVAKVVVMFVWVAYSASAVIVFAKKERPGIA